MQEARWDPVHDERQPVVLRGHRVQRGRSRRHRRRSGEGRQEQAPVDVAGPRLGRHVEDRLPSAREDAELPGEIERRKVHDFYARRP
ncbi:unnamed protein product [Linum tenue]|uniref:Uncharacterized protein n=1 Tax=Linum tenue TaxID=586396 RepID=A0AAV0JCE1_9ROSI|nr:unnamed protein product [Linum tenue]